MLILVAARVWISISKGSITTFVPRSVPLLPRTFGPRPNHVPGTDRLVSLTTFQTQSRGLRSSSCLVSSTREFRICTREIYIYHEFYTIIGSKFVNSDSTRWKQCAPIWQIYSGSLRLQPRVLLIVSKNIEFNEHACGWSTRRRIKLL